MKNWKPEKKDGLLLLGIGLGAIVGLLRGAVLAWLPVGVVLGFCLWGSAGVRSRSESGENSDREFSGSDKKFNADGNIPAETEKEHKA